MPLPSAGCPQPIIPPDRCNDLFDTAELILSAAWRSIEGFYPDPAGPCGRSIQTYVSQGEMAFDCCDVLTVHIASLAPRPSSQINNQLKCNPVLDATWVVEFVEACYPVVDEDGFPSAGEMHEVNRFVYAHGLGLYGGVISEYMDGTMLGPDTRCQSLEFGPLLPIEPQGACTGWFFTMTGVYTPLPIGP